jgi:hypothetical protein
LHRPYGFGVHTVSKFASSVLTRIYEFGSIYYLLFRNMAGNMFAGPLPYELLHCSPMLEVM